MNQDIGHAETPHQVAAVEDPLLGGNNDGNVNNDNAVQLPDLNLAGIVLPCALSAEAKNFHGTFRQVINDNFKGPRKYRWSNSVFNEGFCEWVVDFEWVPVAEDVAINPGSCAWVKNIFETRFSNVCATVGQGVATGGKRIYNVRMRKLGCPHALERLNYNQPTKSFAWRYEVVRLQAVRKIDLH